MRRLLLVAGAAALARLTARWLLDFDDGRDAPTA